MDQEKREQNRTVVFFDGVCHLCNGFVDWAVARDQNKQLLFAPLQGSTAASSLNLKQREKLESVLVLDRGEVFEKSDAVLRVLSRLPRWKWTAVFRLFPRALRDAAYDFVARNRYRWFGKKETCRLPTPEERQSILP
jgi:predicted DCC family thiol-disulfide oxidoreductase YuxK